MSVKLWDKNFNMVYEIEGAPAGAKNTLNLPADSPAARWLIEGEIKDPVHLTVDSKDGNRWAGRLESWVLRKNDCGCKRVTATFEDRYEQFSTL